MVLPVGLWSTAQDVHFGATRAGRELQGFADREREARSDGF